MPGRKALTIVCLLILSLAVLPAPVRAGEALPDNDALMRAIVDELTRSMNELVLEDLPQPYFIQYNAEDRLTFSMYAAYGGLLNSDESRYRVISSRARVGSYELDNTNYRGSFGARAALPIDDDYAALRHAIWRMTDGDYKRAVEALTRKVAYLKEKTVVDRPDDFSPAKLAAVVEPSAEITFDRNKWERNLKRLSARFTRHPKIQDSRATLFAGSVNEWVVNSEGARLRKGDTGAYIEVNADIQAPDGMLLANSRSYIGEQIDQLPPMEKMLADVDETCEQLVALADAPVLEHYDGPVLFDPMAAGKVFGALLADRLCARPIPLGSGAWAGQSLEKKIGRRVLPRSFQVVDDPGPKSFEGTILAGAYTYDDEAVRATKVSLVENGILKTLLAGRAPTKKLKSTTGHGRSPGFSDARAHIGCLYISDDNSVTSEALKEALIQAARDEGIEFGLRIGSIQEGGGGVLGDPILAYKVYVEDGREELVRGLEFLPVETRALKHILAAGRERKVYNSPSGTSSSIISPAVLFEELELTKSEKELDKLPILKSPVTRGIVD